MNSTANLRKCHQDYFIYLFHPPPHRPRSQSEVNLSSILNLFILNFCLKGKIVIIHTSLNMLRTFFLFFLSFFVCFAENLLTQSVACGPAESSLEMQNFTPHS